MLYSFILNIMRYLIFRCKIFLLALALQGYFIVHYVLSYHSDFKTTPQSFLIDWFLISVVTIFIAISIVIYIIAKSCLTNIVLRTQKEKYSSKLDLKLAK